MALRDIQSNIQKAKAARDKQLAASTAATQSGSTSTPTTTETPKVTPTPKSVQSTIEQRTTNNISNVKSVINTETNSTPNLKDINLFKIQDVTKTRQQIGQQYGNILSTTQENKDIQSTAIPTSTVNAVIKMGGSALKAVTNTLYKQGEDYAKQRIGAPALNANAFLEGTKLFSTAQGIVGDLTKKVYKDISADIKEEWESGEGVGMIRDFGAYTLEGIPRGLTRGEYGLAELLDWAVDAQWATDLKNNIKKDMEYRENTRVYKRATEVESFKDFMKNPIMYAGGTLTEMLPMFISSWVAIPRTYAQVYSETYSDYSQDESLKEAGLTDNQIRLMAAGVAGVNTLIELGSDLIEGIMPWTRAGVKTTEKTIRRRLSKPFVNIILKMAKGGASEGFEEPIQDEIKTRVAIAAGSDRSLPTWTERLTTAGMSAVIGTLLQGGNIAVEIKGHKELEAAFEEWSEAVDDFAPGVSEEDKKKFFSAIIAAEIEDQQMSDKQVNKYQQESTQLYEQKAQLQEQLEQTTDPRVKQSINYQIENIDARIKDIDKSLNQWQNVMEDVNKQLEEASKKSELPAQQTTTQQQGGENLSEQTMKPVDGNGIKYNKNVLSINKKPVGKDRNNMRNTFEKSFEQVNNKGRDYTATPFANIAYSTSGKKMFGDRSQVNKIKDKIKFIADKAGILLHSTGKLPLGVGGGYGKGNIVYNKKTSFELTTYGHEIFHGMMDIIRNGSMSDTKLGNELKKDMEAILNEAKEYLGIDGYEGEKGKLADKYAEEWLANAFGEYLAEREINLGPKTFKQKVVNFFGRLVNAIFGRERTDKEISPEMKRVFEAIYEGKVTTDYNSSYQQESRASETKMLDEMGMSESSRWNKLLNQGTFKGYKAENGGTLDDDGSLSGKLTNRTIAEGRIEGGFTAAGVLEQKGDISESTKEELNNMREEYNELENELKNNDLTEEEKAEYNTDIDGINQNANMLADLGEEYTDFTSKKISSEGIEDADEATQSNESEMGKTRQEIGEENGQLEADEALQNETTEEELNKQEEPEKEKINTFKEDYEAYLKEKDRQKKGEFKENSKECRRDIWTVAKNILTPTMTRIYNINKRIAGRLTQMETQTGINIYRYTQKTQGFADTFNGLSKGQQLEVSKALFDFGALAKEQTEETLQEYKDNEKKKLRDVLTKNGFKDEDIDSLFEVLNDLGTRYKEAGMDITVTDMYFPRTVRDYKGLIRYLNEHSETPIQGKNARTIYNEIKKITEDPTLSDAQKESEIRKKLSENFSPKVSTKTKYSEERQLGLLREWGAGIYAYYENPIESLASYITSMEQAIQRQLFLGGMKDTQGIDIDIKGQSSDQSVSAIVRDMFEKGQITESQMNELHTCLMAVLNKKGTPRWVRAIKDITYTMALTNYISAMNQAEDIGVAIIENKKGLISVLKSIFTKAGIKYDEAGLESAYEMFKTNSKPSDWLFKKSGFNAIDRMGKRSFLNAAWNSMVQTYKNPKARGHMYERLKAMYGDETANHIMECIRTNNFMNDGEIDIDVLTDLLYQLGNTQPIYQSSMPVSYLQHPEARWLYALSMFSLRQIDHIIQSTKSAYEEGGLANAAYVGFKLITARMFFNALIGGVTSLLQGDLDDSWIWKLFEGDWEGAGKLFGGDMLKGFLKVWMFSKYDWNVRKSEGIWAFAANRLSPYILQEGFKGRRAIQKALKNDDPTELMTMLRDVPLLGKQAYGRWKFYQDNILVDPFDKAFDEAFDQAFDGAFDEAFDNAFDEAFDKSFDKSFDKAFK